MAVTRRNLLLAAGLGATSTWLASCAGGEPPPAPAGPSAGSTRPRRGGILRAAFTGGGAAETLDPFNESSPADYVRNQLVYDPLFTVRGGRPVPRLAVAAEPDASGSSFTLRLRRGVRWHDGSPFGARDVLHSLRYLASPDRPFPSELLTYLDIERVRIGDEVTLSVPTLRPVGDPVTLLAASSINMIKDGATSFDVSRAAGTGPYRITAFEAGRETRLARFDGHWDGPPYADGMVVLSLADAQARVNAVRGRQAHYAADIPYGVARAGTGDPGIEVRTAGPAQRISYGFILNTTRPPFDDPRARRAVRLAVDRKALVDTVFLGFGAVGNDLGGFGAPYFAADIPPPRRDVAAARELVRAAGAEGTEVRVRTADLEVGYNASTELFAQQMRGIGLNVRPQVVSLAEFFDLKALPDAHAVTFSFPPSPLQVLYARADPYPSLRLADPEFQRALRTAVATTDDGERGRAWRRAQEIMAERGNMVVWGLADVLSLARREVTGVQAGLSAKYPYLGKAGLA